MGPIHEFGVDACKDSIYQSLGMGPSTCSLDARSVLGLFYGARARVLESEHMLVLARARG